MATLHQAQLKPSKLELLQAYLPTVSGLEVAGGSELAPLGAYRFDDPAGEVGIESHLLATADGRTVHMPLTYRASPLDGADKWFVGTLDHSALGTRFVYNGCGDPVYASGLVLTILTGGIEAKLEVLTDDGVVERENTVHVRGSGDPGSGVPDMRYGGATRAGADTVINVGSMTVVVGHILSSEPAPIAAHLAGTWPGTPEPVTLATVTSG